MRKRFYFTFTFVLSAGIAFAQSPRELSRTAQSLLLKGEYDEALTKGEKAFQKASKDIGENDTLTIRLQAELGTYEIENAKYEDGFGRLASAANKAETTVGKSTPLYTNILTLLGTYSLYLGASTEAVSFFEKAQSLIIEVYGEKSGENIAAISNLAYAEQLTGAFGKAKVKFKKALSISNEIKDLDPAIKASLCNNIGNLHHDLTEVDKAADYYKMAYDIGKMKSVTMEHRIGAQNLGTAYLDLGNLQKAMDFTEEALRLTAKNEGEKTTAYAVLLNNKALIQGRLNQSLASEQTYKKSLKIKEQFYEADHPSVLKTQANLALMYSRFGRGDEALKLLRQTLELTRKNKKDQPELYATTLYNMAATMFAHGSDSLLKATNLCVENIDLLIELYGPMHPNLVSTYHLAAGILMDPYIKNTAEAQKYLDRSKKILEYHGLKGTEYFQEYLEFQFDLDLMKGDLKGAEESVNHLDTLTIRLNTKASLQYLGTQYDRVMLQVRSKKLSEAGATLDNLLDQQLQMLSGDFRFLSNQQKRAQYNEYRYRQMELIQITAENKGKDRELVANAFYHSLQVKGLLYRSSRDEKQRIHNSCDSQLKKQFEEWIQLRERISALSALGDEETEATFNVRGQLIKKADALEREMKQHSDYQKNDLISRAPTLHTIKDYLKDGEALINIERTPFINRETGLGYVEYTVFIVSRDKSPEFLVLNQGQAIDDSTVYSHNKFIQDGEEFTLSYSAIWKEIEPHVKGIPTLWVWSDGMLNGLNFYTLKDEEGNYLLDKHEIHHIQDFRPLVERDVKSKPKTANLFGNPNYGVDLTAQLTSDTRDALGLTNRTSKANFPQLPGSEKEVNTLNDLLKGSGVTTSVRIGDKATENSVKKVKSPDILHIATHGFWVSWKEDKTKRVFQVKNKEAMRNPLFRSGLLMAGANYVFNDDYSSLIDVSGFDDGVLTAYEAANLDLTGTELVVLSACETGLGEVQHGEGIIGLQGAFLSAGAKSVITSLWPVSDEATQLLMTNFYKEWIESGNKVQAFRNAQLKLKEKYPRPYFWGAFILIER